MGTGRRAKSLRRADMAVRAPGRGIKAVTGKGVRPASAGEYQGKYVRTLLRTRPAMMGPPKFRKARRERPQQQEKVMRGNYPDRRTTRVFRPSGYRPDGTDGKTRGLTTLFCCFIGGLMLLFFLLPKTSFSGMERRSLKDPPVFNAKNVTSGKFEDDAEVYMSDHFPFRLFFVGLNSYSELSQGRTLVNDVYIGQNWWFMQAPAEMDPDNLALNMDAARQLKERLGIPASIIAVPTTGYIMSSELPDVHVPYHDPEIADKAIQTLQDGRIADRVAWMDIVPVMADASKKEQVYYRTDHHWTTTGAYEAYLVWAEQHGVSAPSRSAFDIASHGGFLGTTYAKVLLWGAKPDTVEIWKYPIDVRVELMDADKGMEPVVMDSFYDMEQLNGYDPYAVFFGGNHSVVRITNQAPDATGRLLVIKDSFANCFVPFLARHYKEVVMIDPRYYKDTNAFLDAEQEPFDELLFVYGMQQIMEDTELQLVTQ